MLNQDDPETSNRAGAFQTLIEHWFVETFHGLIIARSTDVWNAVHAAKEDLKARLAELVRSLDDTTPQD